MHHAGNAVLMLGGHSFSATGQTGAWRSAGILHHLRHPFPAHRQGYCWTVQIFLPYCCRVWPWKDLMEVCTIPENYFRQ